MTVAIGIECNVETDFGCMAVSAHSTGGPAVLAHKVVIGRNEVADGEAIARTAVPDRAKTRNGAAGGNFPAITNLRSGISAPNAPKGRSRWTPAHTMGARARSTFRRGGLVECRHLEFASLAVERLTGVLADPLERLPLFATDLLVTGHAQGARP